MKASQYSTHIHVERTAIMDRVEQRTDFGGDPDMDTAVRTRDDIDAEPMNAEGPDEEDGEEETCDSLSIKAAVITQETAGRITTMENSLVKRLNKIITRDETLQDELDTVIGQMTRAEENNLDTQQLMTTMVKLQEKQTENARQDGRNAKTTASRMRNIKAESEALKAPLYAQMAQITAAAKQMEKYAIDAPQKPPAVHSRSPRKPSSAENSGKKQKDVTVASPGSPGEIDRSDAH